MSAGTVISGGFPGRVAQEVTPNQKCSGCLHYDGQAGRIGACTIGSRPWLCGDGGAADIGYAPLVRGAGTYLPGMSNHDAQAPEVETQFVSDLYGAGSTRPVTFEQVSLGEEHVHFIKSMVAQHASLQREMCRLCKSQGSIGVAPWTNDPQVCTCEPIAARDIAKSLAPRLNNRQRSILSLNDVTAFVYDVAKAGYKMPLEKGTLYHESGRYDVSPAGDGSGKHNVDFHPHGGGQSARVGTFGSRREAAGGAAAHAQRFASGSTGPARSAPAKPKTSVGSPDGGRSTKTPPGLPSMRGATSLVHKGEVRSPTKTKTKTSTATEVRSPTSTSTDAYTQGNVTVTGGAGSGDTHVHLHGSGSKQAHRADKKAHEARSRGAADRPEKMMRETGASRPKKDSVEKSLELLRKATASLLSGAETATHRAIGASEIAHKFSHHLDAHRMHSTAANMHRVAAGLHRQEAAQASGAHGGRTIAALHDAHARVHEAAQEAGVSRPEVSKAVGHGFTAGQSVIHNPSADPKGGSPATVGTRSTATHVHLKQGKRGFMVPHSEVSPALTKSLSFTPHPESPRNRVATASHGEYEISASNKPGKSHRLDYYPRGGGDHPSQTHHFSDHGSAVAFAQGHHRDVSIVHQDGR